MPSISNKEYLINLLMAGEGVSLTFDLDFNYNKKRVCMNVSDLGWVEDLSLTMQLPTGIFTKREDAEDSIYNTIRNFFDRIELKPFGNSTKKEKWVDRLKDLSEIMLRNIRDSKEVFASVDYYIDLDKFANSKIVGGVVEGAPYSLRDIIETRSSFDFDLMISWRPHHVEKILSTEFAASLAGLVNGNDNAYKLTITSNHSKVLTVSPNQGDNIIIGYDNLANIIDGPINATNAMFYAENTSLEIKAYKELASVLKRLYENPPTGPAEILTYCGKYVMITLKCDNDKRELASDHPLGNGSCGTLRSDHTNFVVNNLSGGDFDTPKDHTYDMVRSTYVSEDSLTVMFPRDIYPYMDHRDINSRKILEDMGNAAVNGSFSRAQPTSAGAIVLNRKDL